MTAERSRPRPARCPRGGGRIARFWATLGMVACSCFVGVGVATAQTSVGGRLSVHLNVGYQVASEEFRQRLAFTAYGETARLEAGHDISGGLLFDAGGFFRVWDALAVGATFSQVDGADMTLLTGTVPHPIRTNTDRTVDGETRDLTHRERATHVHLAWSLPLPEADRFVLRLMGGPTYFNLTQSGVGGVAISEAEGPPFATVSVDSIAIGDLVKNGWGAHVGVDAAFMVSGHVGVGAFLRFARGSVDVPVGESLVTLSVGGLQTGGGLRVEF